jgi:predicted transposase YdaD
MKKGKEKPKHDSAYKRLFTHPKMVRDLLKSLVNEPWVDDLDFAALEDAANSLIDESFKRSEGDMVLRIPWKVSEGAIYLTLLLEFQSSPDKWMVARALQYTALIYDALIRRKVVGDKLPPVLVIVLYNGAEPWEHPTDLRDLIGLPKGSALWDYQPGLRLRLLDERHLSPAALGLPDGLTALVLRSEQATSPTDFAALAQDLKRHTEADDWSLYRDFIGWWLRVLCLSRNMEPPQLPDNPQEVQHMLEEHVKAWEDSVRRQALQQGIQQGVQQGVQQGIQQGVQQGLREGIAESLSRIVEARFGAPDAEVKAAISQATLHQLEAWLVASVLKPWDEVRALILAG